MKWLRLRLSAHCLVLGIAIASIAATLNPALAAALRYRRAAIEAGQWWRLLSAHLVHFDVAHLALNLAALAIVCAMFAGHLSQRVQLSALLFSGLVVGLGLWFAEPQVLWYVGLSGALHGLFVAGVMGWWRERRMLAVLVLCGLAAKLVLENSALNFWRIESHMPVVTAAHRWGAAGGALFVFLFALLLRFSLRFNLHLALLAQRDRQQHQQGEA